MSLLMLLNVMFSAAWVHAAAFEFVDSAYSPEKGIYVVMGKEYRDWNNHFVQVWVSNDLMNWETKLFSGLGTNYGNRIPKQNLVWWEKEQVFVLALGGSNVYTSEDGLKWTVRENMKADGSGTVVDTNGDQLVLAGRHKVKVINSLDDPGTVFQYAGDTSYASSIGVTDDAPPKYMLSNNMNVVYTLTAEDGFANPQSSVAGSTGLAVIDMAYAPSCGGWFLITGSMNSSLVKTYDSAIYFKDKNGNTTKIAGLSLAGGGSTDVKLTAVGINDADDMIVGAEDGSLYVAQANGGAASLKYTKIEAGKETEPITAAIGSISGIDENNFLFAAGDKFYIAQKQGNTYNYYRADSIFIAVDEDDLRIEAPVSDEEIFNITPQITNVLGKVSQSTSIRSCELVGTPPEGILAQNAGDHLAVTVSPEAEGGEITFQAIADNGVSKDFTITLVNEDHLEVVGAEALAIPLEGDEPSTYAFSAKVIGTDGKEMDREASVELASELPEGVSYENGTVTVRDIAQNGEIKLKFVSVARPEIFIEKTIRLEERVPSKVEVTSGDDTVFVPDNGEKTYTYTAKVYDQSGVEMPKETVVWSISQNGQAVPGVAISKKTVDEPAEETAVLTVKSDAGLEAFHIRVTSEENKAIYVEKEINCTASDSRYVREDLNELQAALKLVEKNTTIPKTGKYGTEFSWKSTDANIITAEGKIICPSRATQTVKLTVTGTKNQAKQTKTFDVEVTKADTLVENGDIELGTTEGWNTAEGTMNVSQDAYNGQYALSVNNEVYREMEALTNDSSYAFYAYVKAPKGTKIQIYSETGGKAVAEATAGDGYTAVKGSYDYRKQKDTFADKIYIRANGEFLVDDFKVFEITVEYNAAAKAVADAEYSRKQADIDSAQKVLNAFYDLPVRDALQKRLNAIVPKTSGGGSGGGGGYTPPSTNPGVNPIYPAGENQSNNDYEDALDTALLKFKDMKGHWAKADVEYMAGLELVSGKEEGVFAPDETVTRAEFAVLVTRAMGLSAVEYENSFFDIVSEDWYSGYVQAAKTAGYMNGSDGLFRPNDPITREEIAKVIVAAYNGKSGTKLQKGGALYFNDIDEVSAWAYDYIVEAVDKGFVAGISEDIFAPKANATRAQAVVMLRRVYDELQGGSKAE